MNLKEEVGKRVYSCSLLLQLCELFKGDGDERAGLRGFMDTRGRPQGCYRGHRCQVGLPNLSLPWQAALTHTYPHSESTLQDPSSHPHKWLSKAHISSLFQNPPNSYYHRWFHSILGSAHSFKTLPLRVYLYGGMHPASSYF